jgi:hypothetical protein
VDHANIVNSALEIIAWAIDTVESGQQVAAFDAHTRTVKPYIVTNAQSRALLH